MDMDHDHDMHMTTATSGGHDHNNNGMHMGGMMMYFHVGIKETILFKEWAVSSVGGMFGSVIGIFLLAIVYEGLKYLREHLFNLYVKSVQFSTVSIADQNGSSPIHEVHNIKRQNMLSWSHGIQTILHMFQMIISYFLMLIFMTYNVWLCLAVIFGTGVGYFLFGWKKATVVDVTEHCH